MMVSEEELQALVGHEFPGGRYRIAHWENFLLTEATGRDPMPDTASNTVRWSIHVFYNVSRI